MVRFELQFNVKTTKPLWLRRSVYLLTKTAFYSFNWTKSVAQRLIDLRQELFINYVSNLGVSLISHQGLRVRGYWRDQGGINSQKLFYITWVNGLKGSEKVGFLIL